MTMMMMRASSLSKNQQHLLHQSRLRLHVRKSTATTRLIQSSILQWNQTEYNNKSKALSDIYEKANTNACNSFVHVFSNQSTTVDDDKTNNSSVLNGVPYALKDAFVTSNQNGAKNVAPTTMGSRMLQNYVSSYDSFVYDALSNKCNAQCIGKTNMDEFAMGSGTTYSVFGATRNPWNLDYVAGGSSGGSAASVAEGSSLFSIGTDTGGSVRQPASYCGIVGFKPSYGRISRFGMISFASSLDTMGIFTKHVYDSALVYDELVKNSDPQSENTFNNDNSALFNENSEPIAPQLSSENNKNCKALRVGVPVEYLLDELQPEVLQMWQSTIDKLKQAGATVEYVSLPHTKYALAAYYVIAPSEASSNLSRYDGIRYGFNYKKDMSQADTGIESDDLYVLNRTLGFGDEVKRRILSGTFALSVDKYDTFFKRAQQTRTLVANDFHELLKFNNSETDQDKYDFILTPTTPTTAIKISEFSKLSPVEVYTNDIFTIPASLAGLPSISVPAMISASNGMPLGLQVIGGNELNVLKGALAIEKLCEFKHL